MGLYSVLQTGVVCPQCGWSGDAEVQFKYGNLYSHVYTIGSAILWGRTEVGEPGRPLVAVDGVTTCAQCNVTISVDILVANDIIESASVSTGKYDYHHGEGDYAVVKRLL